ncbi:cupin domain-containing protein [Paraburkholderia sp. 2C]
MKDQSSNKRPVEATCCVIRPGQSFSGKQALLYESGISADTVGSVGIHMQIATIPPLGKAKAHKHDAHETAIYILKGRSGMWYGERLERHLTVSAGEFLYIPANMPHLPYNPSEAESCVAIVTRTDPNEQESVTLLPELDTVHL